MKLLIAVAVLLLLFVGYTLYTFYGRVQESKVLVDAAVPYSKEGSGTPALLVIGDSTGVGVGASRPEDSVAGLLATYLQAPRVDNYAESGARVADLPGQIAKADLGEYDTILVQIGGNDIIRLRPAHEAAEGLAVLLKTLPKTERLVVMSAGNVGGSTLFPFFIRPLHTSLNKAYHTELERVVTDAGGIYVSLYEPPATDPFALDPEKYFAADGLHPSSAGYRVWFAKLLQATKW